MVLRNWHSWRNLLTRLRVPGSLSWKSVSWSSLAAQGTLCLADLAIGANTEDFRVVDNRAIAQFSLGVAILQRNRLVM